MKDLEYINSLRTYLLIITGVFILSLIAGFIVSIKNPQLSETYLETFQQSFGWIKTLNPAAIVLVIFLNNALKSLLALVLGVMLGIVPVLFIAGNGMILSMLASVISKQQGTAFVIAALLPHGIIEVPMILLSAGIGLRLGHIAYFSLKGAKAGIKKEFREGMLFYIRRIVPLLFIAALIETLVTPMVVLVAT